MDLLFCLICPFIFHVAQHGRTFASSLLLIVLAAVPHVGIGSGRGGPGNWDSPLSEEPALMGGVIARTRSSNEKTQKEPYGGVQSEGGAGRAQGGQDSGRIVGEV